jgi:peptidyl-prolyl cis-trans isomerase C
MKLVLNIICWIAAAFCLVFPFTYFQSDMDKQEVEVSHILVDTKEKADELRQLIVNNEKTLEELAEKYSKCNSKSEKGLLKFAPRGTYVPEFEKVAFTQKVGVISEPVQTEYGWHIIRVYKIKYFSDKENFSRRYR